MNLNINMYNGEEIIRRFRHSLYAFVKTLWIWVTKITADHSDLWPAVMAIGEGPFGGRGSSQVLISTSTLSRNCRGRGNRVQAEFSRSEHLMLAVTNFMMNYTPQAINYLWNMEI